MDANCLLLGPDVSVVGIYVSRLSALVADHSLVVLPNGDRAWEWIYLQRVMHVIILGLSIAESEHIA